MDKKLTNGQNSCDQIHASIHVQEFSPTNSKKLVAESIDFGHQKFPRPKNSGRHLVANGWSKKVLATKILLQFYYFK